MSILCESFSLCVLCLGYANVRSVCQPTTRIRFVFVYLETPDVVSAVLLFAFAGNSIENKGLGRLTGYKDIKY